MWVGVGGCLGVFWFIVWFYVVVCLVGVFGWGGVNGDCCSFLVLDWWGVLVVVVVGKVCGCGVVVCVV